MARNALLGLGMVAPDDEWRLTRAVNALGFGPMTPTTQAGRPNALLSAGMPAARPSDYLAPVAETISPIMGGYGAGQMIGEGSRAIGQGDYLSGGAGLALGMAGMIPGAPKGKGIRAFHGSPHDFDRFSMDKIGTGEGAQAYGHGLYFAESEGVAKSYKEKLGGIEWSFSPHNEIERRATESAKRYLKDAGWDDAIGMRSVLLQDDPDLAYAFDDMVHAGRASDVERGNMYEVRINADPEDFLDWDKPAADQPPGVRTKLPPEWQSPTWKGHARTPEGMARLREAGIPGIRYLDQGSRTAGDGSRNYVVFRDDIIEIVKKYGLAAAVSTYGFDAVRGAMEDQQQ